MIRPFCKDDELLANIRETDGGENHFVLWWLGQSGFLLKWHGQFLLFDPYLSDSLTKKYADTGKPHVRMTELVVDPEQLDFIDVATSSHNHTDHLDAETLSALHTSNPELKLVLPAANIDFATDRRCSDIDFTCGADSHIIQSTSSYAAAGGMATRASANGWHAPEFGAPEMDGWFASA